MTHEEMLAVDGGAWSDIPSAVLEALEGFGHSLDDISRPMKDVISITYSSLTAAANPLYKAAKIDDAWQDLKDLAN